MAEDILKLSEEVNKGCGKCWIVRYTEEGVEHSTIRDLCPSCQKAKEVLLKAIEEQLEFLERLDVNELDTIEVNFEEEDKEMWANDYLTERIELLNKCRDMLK